MATASETKGIPLNSFENNVKCADEAAEHYPFPTLDDHLRPGLRLVFVGLNPGLFSAQCGHYFARPSNRFWPAFSRSRLSMDIKAALGREVLGPGDDALLLEFGIGFTDVVKVPTRNAAQLTQADFAHWAPLLRDRLSRCAPSVACFQGTMAWQGFARYALAAALDRFTLGEQALAVGATHLYVVPNPSPANAHFTLQQQVDWYDRLAAFSSQQ